MQTHQINNRVQNQSKLHEKQAYSSSNQNQLCEDQINPTNKLIRSTTVCRINQRSTLWGSNQSNKQAHQINNRVQNQSKLHEKQAYSPSNQDQLSEDQINPTRKQASKPARSQQASKQTSSSINQNQSQKLPEKQAYSTIKSSKPKEINKSPAATCQTTTNDIW